MKRWLLGTLLLWSWAFTPLDADAQATRRKPKRPAVQAPQPPPEPPPVVPEPAPEPAPVAPVVTTPPPAPAEPPRPGPCRKGPVGIPLDPVRTSYAEAGLGAPRRPCARTELALVSRATALVDTAREYRALEATAVAEASWALRPRLELSLAAELFTYQSASLAAVGADRFGLGQLALGGSYLLEDGGGLAYGVAGRALLPTSTLSPGVRTVGLELGAPAAYTLSDALFLHGYAGVQLTGGIGQGPLLPHLGLGLTVGGEYHPIPVLALALDLTARFGTRAVVEEVTPALALRFRAARSLWLELAAALPVAGEHGLSVIDGLRVQPQGALRLSYRP